MQIPLPVSVSERRYKTASSGGLTVVFAAAAGGALTLTDPKGVDHQFRYGSVGVGVGIGARLPRFGKVNLHVRAKASEPRAPAKTSPRSAKCWWPTQ